MNKIHIRIILFLSVLSITLAIILAIKTIEYNKDTGNVPVEEFHDRDYSDRSYHINDYKNYGRGQCTFDKEKGVLIRDIHNSDFYFKPKIYIDSVKIKMGFNLIIFNYGENYRILNNIHDDCVLPLEYTSIDKYLYCILDKSSVIIKENIYNLKYGDAGLTDILLNTYDPVTNKTGEKMHKDVFVTPLALKHIQDAESNGCLVFFQFIESGSIKYMPDKVVREVIAVGDYVNTYIFNDHPDMLYMLYTKDVNEEGIIKRYINEQKKYKY